VHAGYRRYREALVDGGVRLYELRPDAIEHVRPADKKEHLKGSQAALHAKTFVFDRRMVFVGSLNLDPRSVQLNTEIGVVIDSPAMAETMAGRLEQKIDRMAWRVERIVDASGSRRLAWIETNDDGTRQHLEEPGVTFWRGLTAWFAGLLPIESQL
jgi:putative cardiolipin synthase